MATRIPQGPNGHQMSDDALLIAMGCYKGITHKNIHGVNLDISSSFEDVWLQGGTWTKIPTATTLEVASDDANDTLAGTGAQTVTIEGLDVNYAEITETVNMLGTTPVLTTQLFLFVNNFFVATGGTSFTNAGNIYVADDSTAWSSGTPSTAAAIQDKIADNQGEAQAAIYTVPAGKTAYLANAWILSGASKVLDYELHEIDNVNRTNRIIVEGEETNSVFNHIYNPYESVVEKHTLLFRAHITSGNVEVGAGYDIILVNNATYDLD